MMHNDDSIKLEPIASPKYIENT